VIDWDPRAIRLGPSDVPRPKPDLYRFRFDAAEQARKAAVWRVLVRHFFQRFVREQDVVLDVGCGFGEFLNHLRAARRIGPDLDPSARGTWHPA
jgi:SAM-dependent methyltransferase